MAWIPGVESGRQSDAATLRFGRKKSLSKGCSKPVGFMMTKPAASYRRALVMPVLNLSEFGVNAAASIAGNVGWLRESRHTLTFR
jgi:hypothetical protein